MFKSSATGRFRRLSVATALLLGAGLLASCGSDDAGGSDDSASLAGETIQLVVPYDPGGGFDVYARLLAPYLEDALDATVTVVNKPGAGGLLAVNQLKATKPDGKTLVLMNGPGVAAPWLADADSVQVDVSELSMIGRISSTPQVGYVPSGSSFESIEDVLADDGFRWGSVGVGGSDYLNPVLLNSVLGLEQEIVTGFGGTGDVDTALERGDVDGTYNLLDSSAADIESGAIRPLVVIAAERVPELTDVPAVTELDLGEEGQEIYGAHVTLDELGRSIVGPPEIPAATLDLLREAFDTAANDPEFVAKAEQTKRPLAYASGEELDKTVASLEDAPESYIEILKSVYDISG